MSLSKPMLGLITGGTLGLLDGLSGFFEPSLAPVMTSVITFSMLKGLLSAGDRFLFAARSIHAVGIVRGDCRCRSFESVGDPKSRHGPLLGHHAAIMRPGMLLGLIVGFATQKFGKRMGGSASQ
jgi:hypothetical protein